MDSEIVEGNIGGSVQGAQTGASIGGPWGALIGGIAGGIHGIIKGAEAAKLRKDYEKKEKALPLYDPTQIAYLNNVAQQERLYRSGMDASSALAARLQGNATAQTQLNLLRAGGPSTVQNLLRSQAVGQNQAAIIGANGSQAANDLMRLRGRLIDNIAERVYSRQREIRNQAMDRYALAAQGIKNQAGSAMGAIPGQETFGGMFGGGRQKQVPQQQGAQMGSPAYTSSYTDRSLGQPVTSQPTQAPYWQTSNPYAYPQQPTQYRNYVQTEPYTAPDTIQAPQYGVM